MKWTSAKRKRIARWELSSCHSVKERAYVHEGTGLCVLRYNRPCDDLCLTSVMPWLRAHSWNHPV